MSVIFQYFSPRRRILKSFPRRRDYIYIYTYANNGDDDARVVERRRTNRSTNLFSTFSRFAIIASILSRLFFESDTSVLHFTRSPISFTHTHATSTPHNTFNRFFVGIPLLAHLTSLALFVLLPNRLSSLLTAVCRLFPIIVSGVGGGPRKRLTSTLFRTYRIWTRGGGPKFSKRFPRVTTAATSPNPNVAIHITRQVRRRIA